MYKKILIIADIEGSSGCADYEASSFNTASWYDACIDMSLDINSVAVKLFESGAENIYIKDFHRTGYNLLPELIDRRAQVIHGYRRGPVPGIGNVYDAEAVMFIGMHASSGSGGFLAHTFTSRYSRFHVNGRRVSELQLFASSLYGHALTPVFFSGCPAACHEAAEDIPGISLFHVVKDGSGNIDRTRFREGLARAAAESLRNNKVSPWIMLPPFAAGLTMRDGAAAAEKISRRWGLYCSGDKISFTCGDFNSFYDRLIKITYLTPLLAAVTPAALLLFNLYGKIGLSKVRWRKRVEIKKIIDRSSLFNG